MQSFCKFEIPLPWDLGNLTKAWKGEHRERETRRERERERELKAQRQRQRETEERRGSGEAKTLKRQEGKRRSEMASRLISLL